MSYKPSMCLNVNINSLSDADVWIDDVASPLWNYYPYKWTVDFSIELQGTSSDTASVIPFSFSGLDVKIGDWFSDASGKVYKISDIVNADATELTAVIEDVGQFNTNNDPTQTGFGAPTLYFGIIFTLDVNGIPNLESMSINRYSGDIFPAIMSRFTSKNTVYDFVKVYQTNHGFNIGDFIRVDPDNDGRYELCGSNEINLAVGVVNTINNPRTDDFTFKPLTEIIDNIQPDLIGDYGDIFYLDPNNPGKVTNVKPLSGKVAPVYIRLETPNRAVRLNAITDENTISVIYKATVTTDDQLEFVLPAEAEEVLVMSINGIENKNYIYDRAINTLTFDPDATGYGVETSDEVIFTYNKLA